MGVAAGARWPHCHRCSCRVLAAAVWLRRAGGNGGRRRREPYYGGASRYKDPRQPLNRRIADLLGRMTLAEKIGQMSQIERDNATADVVRSYFVGSVLSGGGSTPAPRAPAAAWAQMVDEMQRAALSTRLGMPMIFPRRLVNYSLRSQIYDV